MRWFVINAIPISDIDVNGFYAVRDLNLELGHTDAGGCRLGRLSYSMGRPGFVDPKDPQNASDELPREFVPFPFRTLLVRASLDTTLHELQTHVRSRATYSHGRST
jgi:hypothetical protein